MLLLVHVSRWHNFSQWKSLWVIYLSIYLTQKTRTLDQRAVQKNSTRPKMAIYTVIKLSITSYTEEPIYIFTDSLNSLYLINTHIIHPSIPNNHPNKTLLSEIVTMLQSHTTLISLHKVKAHINITGNKMVDTLAKNGRHKPHSPPTEPHEYAHSTPYYLDKDEWIGMDHIPYQGPIRNLQRYLQNTPPPHT
jgi:ribonuclease HI